MWDYDTPDDTNSLSPEKMRERIEERVDEGISFLNAVYEPEWIHHVNLDRFDISRSNMCIGAHLEESFGVFQVLHLIYGWDAVSRGFDTFGGDLDQIDMLNRVWREKITDLRNA